MTRTRSGAYLLLTIAGDNYSEMRFLPADEPTGSFQAMEPRRRDVEYYADHHAKRFVIWTNDRAPNFRVMEAPVRSPGSAHWRELIAAAGRPADRRRQRLPRPPGGLRAGATVRATSAYRTPTGGSNVRYVAFPDPVYTFRTDTFRDNVNPEYATSRLRFQYSSFVTPESTIDYDLAHGTWTVAKRQAVPGGFDPSRYVARRLTATAPDGAQVPMVLVHRRELALDGRHPMLLEGYGAYGRSVEPGFNERLLSLLDRGFVYAIAHVRGSSHARPGMVRPGAPAEQDEQLHRLHRLR